MIRVTSARSSTTRRRLHVRTLATGRHASWGMDRFLGRLTVPAFALTRDWVYVLDFSRADDGRLVVYRGRLS